MISTSAPSEPLDSTAYAVCADRRGDLRRDELRGGRDALQLLAIALEHRRRGLLAHVADVLPVDVAQVGDLVGIGAQQPRELEDLDVGLGEGHECWAAVISRTGSCGPSRARAAARG